MKVFERIMRRNLVNYLEFFNKLDPNQYGSRAGRSTFSQLLQHQNEILQALEEGSNIDCIYLDFAKAYDKVDHGILIHKLKALGIGGKIGRWILCFLTGRNQQVLIRGRKSSISILISGVPQGSVLGPLLFLIFIADLSEGVTSSILVYVDDSKSKQKVNKPEDVEIHQENLNKIYQWEQKNNMEFNGGKFLVLRYGKNKEIKESTLYFTRDMDQVIEQVNNCRDLGITMSDDASFEAQKVCKKVKQKCGWIQRTFYSREKKFMKHIFNTLVQPHLDYCSQIWYPPEGGQLEKLENLLKTFTSKIPAVKDLIYWDRLKELKMNSIQRRFERYKIIYTWKILENMVPNPGIQEMKSESKGRQVLIPKLKPLMRTHREASFQVAGPNLFNKMPRHIRDLTKCSQEDFKKILDSYLSKIPDNPKTKGLVPAALTSDCKPSNSLLSQVDWSRRQGLV